MKVSYFAKRGKTLKREGFLYSHSDIVQRPCSGLVMLTLCVCVKSHLVCHRVRKLFGCKNLKIGHKNWLKLGILLRKPIMG